MMLELGLSVNNQTVPLDCHGVIDIARSNCPGTCVFHHHIGADAGTGIHQAGVQAGGKVGVHSVGGLVLEGGHHRVFGRYRARQSAAGPVGDLRHQLGLGLRDQVGRHVAIGIKHLGFEFQVPVGACGQSAGRAYGLGTCVEVHDARLAGLHVGQLCAEHGEAC